MTDRIAQWYAAQDAFQLGWYCLLGVIALASVAWGIIQLRRWRQSRSQEQLLSGVIFTGVVPALLVWMIVELVKAKFYSGITTTELEPTTRYMSQMCYYRGGLTITSLPPAFAHYRKRLVGKFRHRLPKGVVDRHGSDSSPRD